MTHAKSDALDRPMRFGKRQRVFPHPLPATERQIRTINDLLTKREVPDGLMLAGHLTRSKASLLIETLLALPKKGL